jgi:hypothetical protein
VDGWQVIVASGGDNFPGLVFAEAGHEGFDFDVVRRGGVGCVLDASFDDECEHVRGSFFAAPVCCAALRIIMQMAQNSHARFPGFSDQVSLIFRGLSELAKIAGL